MKIVFNLISVFFSAFLCCCGAYTVPNADPLIFPRQKANPENSKTFTRVTRDGGEVVLDCPTGFVFSKEELKCVLTNSRYRLSSLRNLSTPSCPDFFRGTMLNPTNCRTFIDCWDGLGYEMPCAAHLLYSESLGSCDYPEIASCCEYWEKNSSQIVQSS